MNTDTVWYACYGSNLKLARFLCYLQGGRPHAGGRLHSPARDPSPPREWKPCDIRHRLYFAESSSAWDGGGVAFLSVEPTAGSVTPGRIYRITPGQFEDVFAAENARKRIGLDLDDVPRLGSLVVYDDAWYGRILHLGDEGGRPIFTFTRRVDVPEAEHRRPSAIYTDTIGAGLRELEEELR